VKRVHPFCAALFLLSGLTGAWAGEIDFTGYVEPEIRLFVQEPSQPRQTNANLSIAGELTARYLSGDDRHSLVFTPFGRLDQHDQNRTHWDIRELRYGFLYEDWELRVGFDKVFWGVTEAVHLVDIVNQTDLIEDPIKQEVKLGQPMLRLRTTQSFGNFDFFVLPVFRERSFPGPAGRPSLDLVIDDSLARFESRRKRRHVDFATRYSANIGPFDFGLAYFQGTGRDPILEPAISPLGQLVLAPLYPQIKQVSLDAQATSGAWAYKFEGFWRREAGSEYEAATGGIEYTFFNAIGGRGDLGLVAEYALDSRGRHARNPYQNDAFMALRWSANDAASTSLLAGGVIDAKSGALAFRMKGERRLGNDYRLSLEAYLFGNVPRRDPLHGLADDDYLQLRIARFF